MGLDGNIGIFSGGVSFTKIGSCILRTECGGLGLGFSISVSPSLNISGSEFDISPFVNLPPDTLIDSFWSLSGSVKILGSSFGGEISSGGELGIPIDRLSKGVGSSASL